MFAPNFRFYVIALLLGLTSTLYAQPGTTVNYEDNLGPLTLSYDGQVNGKASYFTSTDNITIQFQNGRWEIFCCLDPVNELLFTSDVNTLNNPPDLATGNWADADGGDGTTLIALNGNGTTSMALPVDLTSFYGQAREKSNLLAWTTSVETDNERFLVERSATGYSFSAIGEVAGQGTISRSTHLYDFSDDQPLPGLNYYRLRQIDFDGTFSLSEVISVENETTSKAALQIFPNPASADNMEIRYFSATDGEVQISLISATGRVLATVSHNVANGWNNLQLPNDNLRSGIFLVQVAKDNEIESLRVVIR